MDMLDALEVAFGHAHGVVAGVGADQMDAPTPCHDWDLQTLIGHMMGVVANCGRGAGGEELLTGPVALPLQADVAGQFRAEADRTLGAWRACPLDGEVNIGAGPMPARAALGINLLDTTTHTWDIARATGQDGTLPDDLATTVLRLSPGIVTDERRAFAGFKPAIPVPADAPPTDRLVAFLGRRP